MRKGVPETSIFSSVVVRCAELEDLRTDGGVLEDLHLFKSALISRQLLRSSNGKNFDFGEYLCPQIFEILKNHASIKIFKASIEFHREILKF